MTTTVPSCRITCRTEALREDRPMSRLTTLATLVLVAACLVVSAGCSRSPEAKKARHLERGEKFLARKAYKDAVIEYRNVLRLEPANAVAIRNIGLAHYQAGELQDAFPYLRKATEQLCVTPARAKSVIASSWPPCISWRAIPMMRARMRPPSSSRTRRISRPSCSWPTRRRGRRTSMPRCSGSRTFGPCSPTARAFTSRSARSISRSAT